MTETEVFWLFTGPSILYPLIWKTVLDHRFGHVTPITTFCWHGLLGILSAEINKRAPLHFVHMWIFAIYYFCWRYLSFPVRVQGKQVMRMEAWFQDWNMYSALSMFRFLCWHLPENRRILARRRCWIKCTYSFSHNQIGIFWWAAK